jgi:hypothetical protein
VLSRPVRRSESSTDRAHPAAPAALGLTGAEHIAAIERLHSELVD